MFAPDAGILSFHSSFHPSHHLTIFLSLAQKYEKNEYISGGPVCWT